MFHSECRAYSWACRRECSFPVTAKCLPVARTRKLRSTSLSSSHLIHDPARTFVLVAMASITENTRSLAPTTPKKVLAAIHNIPQRMRSGNFRPQQQQLHPPETQSQPRAPGKENVPPGQETAAPPRPRRPAPLLPKSSTHVFGLGLPLPRDLDAPSPPLPAWAPPPTHARRSSSAAAASTSTRSETSGRWAAKDGRIIIKVWVPTTDDVWKVRVPADVGLAAFETAVEAKIGFKASFSAVMPDGCLRTVGEEDVFRRWVEGRVRDGRNTLLTAHRLELQ
ncbi:hypothetical protein BV20DRAFT_141558 [Pilatotrama ljubarskyi]|nr:hypothetical protein BV20DRAFT_141558 [Pilatotrama ljubarskyi]